MASLVTGQSLFTGLLAWVDAGWVVGSAAATWLCIVLNPTKPATSPATTIKHIEQRHIEKLRQRSKGQMRVLISYRTRRSFRQKISIRLEGLPSERSHSRDIHRRKAHNQCR